MKTRKSITCHRNVNLVPTPRILARCGAQLVKILENIKAEYCQERIVYSKGVNHYFAEKGLLL